MYQKRMQIFGGIMLAIIALIAIFISPEFLAITGTALAIVPIWGSVKDATFKELTVEEVEKLESGEQVKYFNELNAHKEKKMEDFKTKLKKESSEEIKTKMEALKSEMNADNLEQMKVLQKAMEEQGMALRKLSGGQAPTKETFEEYLETNKELLVSIVKGGVNKTIVVKADTLRSSLTDSREFFRVPDIGQIATRSLKLYDLFAKVPVGAGSGGNVMYYDWDEPTTERAAAVVAENGVFPISTAKWKWYSKPLVKVGDTLPVSEEFDKDLPMFAAELAQFLQINVDIITDTQLYGGLGTGEEMTGAYVYADTYTAVASGITDASIYDLVVDVKRNMTAGKGSKFMPNFVLMNPSDIIKYKLKKDGNNNYVMPPFVSKDGKSIDSILVIETSSVTANTMLVGDNRFPKIYEVDGYTLVKGLADGDFVSDMFTLKARRRLMLLVKNADSGCLNKVTSISAALTTLATA
jgi:hypothetical protein